MNTSRRRNGRKKVQGFVYRWPRDLKKLTIFRITDFQVMLEGDSVLARSVKIGWRVAGVSLRAEIIMPSDFV